VPTGVSLAKPRAYSALRSAALPLTATVPAIDEPTSPIGELRVPPRSWASTLPSADTMDARAGASARRASASPSSSPGNTRCGSHSIASPGTGSTTSPRTVPNTRVRTVTGTRASPLRSPPGRRTDTAVAVATDRAFSYAARNERSG
jgi:hypothetical protein